MSAHTKGPWLLSTVQTTIGSCHKIGPFPSGGARGESYACVYADGIRIGVDDNIPMAVELLANARLIAAAPDLLDVLSELERAEAHYRLVFQTAPSASHLDVGRAWDRMAKAGNKARSAIAKATGEQP